MSKLSSGIIQLDPWLEPFKAPIKQRFAAAQKWIKTIDDTEGGLEKFSRVCTHASSSTSVD
jgi:1,4-alpha-glucan branching enzyme